MSTPFTLEGRTVLVTGASSGIGRDTAIALSELGATVVAVARRREQLEATVGMLSGGPHAVEPFDLIDLDAIPAWLKDLTRRVGTLHGVVHAAGIRATMPLRGVTPASLRQHFDLNVGSAVMLVKGLRQKDCRATPTSVVLVGSVAGLVGSPGLTAYSASKAALGGVTRGMASELAREGIRVNCIAPGLVDSPITDEIKRTLTAEQFAGLAAEYPLGLGVPRDVALAAAYLLSDASRWMTGQTLVLDGGFSMQ